MKKRAHTIHILPLLILTFTSCDVHFGNAHYDVPWWIIAIPIAIIIIVAHWLIIRKTYECPECKTKFKPRWYDIRSWLHIGGKRMLKCPNCHKKGFFSPANE